MLIKRDEFTNIFELEEFEPVHTERIISHKFETMPKRLNSLFLRFAKYAYKLTVQTWRLTKVYHNINTIYCASLDKGVW